MIQSLPYRSRGASGGAKVLLMLRRLSVSPLREICFVYDRNAGGRNEMKLCLGKGKIFLPAVKAKFSRQISQAVASPRCEPVAHRDLLPIRHRGFLRPHPPFSRAEYNAAQTLSRDLAGHLLWGHHPVSGSTISMALHSLPKFDFPGEERQRRPPIRTLANFRAAGGVVCGNIEPNIRAIHDEITSASGDSYSQRMRPGFEKYTVPDSADFPALPVGILFEERGFQRRRAVISSLELSHDRNSRHEKHSQRWPKERDTA